MSKAALTACIVFGVLSAVVFNRFVLTKTTTNANPISETVKKEVVKKTFGEPKRIIISSIAVDTDIEVVGLDSKNRMDVPKNADNVGWYSLGTKPGVAGNSVIAGHLDSKSGPAVFYDLKNINSGDVIQVVDDLGNKQNFKVTRTEVFYDSEFPVDLVFGTSDKPKLNLITCHGTYSRNAQNYNQRLVVFSELVE